MIDSETTSSDCDLAFPALVADRVLLLAAISIFAHPSISRLSSALSSAATIFVLQAVFAFAYNGKKFWRVSRKVTRRQISSAGMIAFAMVVQFIGIFTSSSRLGTFQTAIVYFFFEFLLELTPPFDVVRKTFLSSRLSPAFASRRRSFQSNAKTATALIALAFLVICVCTDQSQLNQSSETVLINKDKEPAPVALSTIPRFSIFFSNFQAVIYVCCASAIGFVVRGFMSGGIRATGFSSLRRAYGIYLCLAACFALSMNLMFLIFNRNDKTEKGFDTSWLILYPVAALACFLFNSPSRDRKSASRSMTAFISIIVGCFFFRLILQRELLWSASEGAVAVLAGASILVLTMPSTMTYRIDALFGPSELRSIFRHVMDRPTTRKIFVFLCMNFMFTFVEVVYGYWTNSIGLISDAVHMLFDCTALAIGLYASYVARLQENEEYPFGYGRFEVLSGYINGIFLVFISFSVFVESVERLFDPPDIEGMEILVVAVLGLLVNVIGLIFFREAHSHSHGSDGCHNHNSNMQGIFLHVLADALGSVGVIISSLLVHFFNFTIADPICSLIIAVLILSSVVNLLQETSLILLQRSPPDIELAVPKIVNKVLSIDGVIGLRDFYAWSFRSDQRICSLCVHVDSKSDGQSVLSDIKTILRKLGIQQISVQIESDDFVSRLEPEVRTRYRRVESVLQYPLKLDVPSPDEHSHSHSLDYGHHSHDHGHSHAGHHGHSHS